MKRILKIFSGSVASLAAMMLLASCEKETYSFGEIAAPRGLTLSAVVEGADASNPSGNGSGRVTINAKADKALTYKIDFGDGKTQMVPTGQIQYKYATPGTADYTITVNAIGTGGTQTVLSKKVSVFVRFELPADIVTALTGTGTKTWATDKAVDGHFGVGPIDQFAPIWYSATPNSRDACAYDDLITFSKDAAGNISLNVDSKGAIFSIGAATSFYGVSGGDGCYPISTGGTKKLKFFDATSGSNANVSRMIEFEVPGNGIVNFGTGSTVYEILSITNQQLHLRCKGVDGNAWYMKLKAQ